MVETIFTKLYEHHDLLRAVFRLKKGRWEQYNHGIHPLKIKEVDLTGDNDPVRSLEEEAGTLQTSIDLENGPLIKVALFHLPDGDRILVIIHHLVIDTVSWRILFEDFQTLLQQSREGIFKLPSKSNSFKEWAEQMVLYANSKDLLEEKKFWKQMEDTLVQFIPKDQQLPGRREFKTVEVSFSKEETKTLLSVTHNVFNAGMNDILLTALTNAMKKITGNDKLLVALEGHGREDIIHDMDISRTIGWFTSMYPVILDIAAETDPAIQLEKVKKSLRRIPHKGIGYGILKHLAGGENKKDLSFRLSPHVSFNYLGQFDEDLENISLQVAKESAGKMKSDAHHGLHDLEIKGLIAGHKLALSVSYCSNDYKQSTVAALLHACQAWLQEIMIPCKIEKSARAAATSAAYRELSVQDLESLFD